MKKIAVIFNGGTISMKVDERIKAAVPSLTGEEIMSMVTGIEEYAEIESYSFSSMPSPHMTFKTMLELSEFSKELLNREDIDGVVITHGTDTLEEITEIMSKVSLNQLNAPCIVYNLDGYYDSLKAMLKHMIEMGLSSEERQKGIYFTESLEQITDILCSLKED